MKTGTHNGANTHNQLQAIVSVSLSIINTIVIDEAPITILNSARVVANKLALILEKEALKQNQNVTPLHEFFVSELTQNFNESTQIFFGKQIELKEIKLNY
jgi:glutamate racemase